MLALCLGGTVIVRNMTEAVVTIGWRRAVESGAAQLETWYHLNAVMAQRVPGWWPSGLQRNHRSRWLEALIVRSVGGGAAVRMQLNMNSLPSFC